MNTPVITQYSTLEQFRDYARYVEELSAGMLQSMSANELAQQIGRVKAATRWLADTMQMAVELQEKERQNTIEYQIQLRKLARERKDRRGDDAGVPARGEI